MEDVAKACCDFLIKHLEPANVIGISRFAEEIGCTELQQHCREYVNTHFSEVMGTSSIFSWQLMCVSDCKFLGRLLSDQQNFVKQRIDG